MTPRQLKLYWDEWRRCEPLLGGTLDRHEIHRQALGYDKSSRKLSNKEFDKILAHFRSINAPADLNAQIRIQDQPRIRIMHVIRRLLGEIVGELGTQQQADAYLAALLRDRFHVRAIDDITTAELPNLIRTLNARLRSLRTRRMAHKAYIPSPTPRSRFLQTSLCIT